MKGRYTIKLTDIVSPETIATEIGTRNMDMKMVYGELKQVARYEPFFFSEKFVGYESYYPYEYEESVEKFSNLVNQDRYNILSLDQDCCGYDSDLDRMKKMIDFLNQNDTKFDSYLYCSPFCSKEMDSYNKYERSLVTEYREALDNRKISQNIIIGRYLSESRGESCGYERSMVNAFSELEFVRDSGKLIKKNYERFRIVNKDYVWTDLEIFIDLLGCFSN